ncbi:MAG: SUF system NifU family Fe-S cluster assembly protein [Candidatus Latescibacteria bacterium]|nr:SUF system NifU family Fe-S cluster assembly protein [Candidatus Latescibacterota bacterium]NIM21741.1 SUF system NifU family Fe-S cluster assembly protein [Candidatus Latescibacterota bacterium]NIM65879.1 SUF system NifU family Fe-S cluster assembly protein [Candidatus Latescibacterota bacterium]NIO02624.1 SUF system NifU family Fe-S cluster assembly protein [Candidatus Latescibacterota bacterium]NIO29605.1 SUF system NifU family Fe-S cluster assembly protein [Candidatus Latescibacterota ba
MSDLRELYQELIVDHHKNPRNFRKLEVSSHHAVGNNPICGDRITVHLLIKDDAVEDIAFEGTGCAICTASASVMTETVKGRHLWEVESLFDRFHDVVTGSPDEAPDTSGLGKLAAFAGVREFPMRVKCATLAWHTMHAAIEKKNEPVTTE